MLYNINPNAWGEPFWNTFHIITFAYPDNPTDTDKQNILNFFHSVKHILPCETCRYHFEENLTKYPLTDDILSSRYKLVVWLITIHNDVNVRLGKSQVSVETVIEKYTGINTNKNKLNEWLTPLLLVILIIVLITYIKLN